MCDLVNIDTSVTGGMTVCGWINRPAGGDRKLCSNRQAANAAGGGFTCAIYNDHMEMDICSATARILARDSGGPTLPVNTWVHVAWVFDDAGDLFKEYHDGVMVDSDAVTVSVGVSTAPFRIGGDSPTIGIYYLGLMDDWRVYDHALTESELQDAMAGKGPNDEFASRAQSCRPGDGRRSRDRPELDAEQGGRGSRRVLRNRPGGRGRREPGQSRDGAGQPGAGGKRLPAGGPPRTGTDLFLADRRGQHDDRHDLQGRNLELHGRAASYPIQNVTATASGASSVRHGPAKRPSTARA